MHTLTDTLDSLWQVVLVGLLLGAGLPAIFAVGLRALAVGEEQPQERPVIATGAAYLCFAAVLVAIAAGILFIMKDFLASSVGISVF